MSGRAWTTWTTVLAVLLLCAAPAVAQQDEEADEGDGGQLRVALQAGYQEIDAEALNARLGGRGIPTFSDDFLSLGATAGVVFDPVLVEAEAEALVEKKSTTLDFRRKLSGGRLYVNLGWPVYPTRRLRLHPYGGVGVGTVRLESVETGPVPFDELLDDAGPATRLHNTEVVLQLGLGADVNLNGWSLGARTGYAFAPADADWKAEDVPVLDGPDVGLEGFFVKGSVGLGGWSVPGGGDDGG